jgi:hypothetical protein
MRLMRLLTVPAVGVCLVFGAAVLATPAGGRTAETAGVADAAGNLHIPAGYRTSYEFLGSWSVADDKESGAKQLHMVYASPGTAAAYRKDGRFPDGAVLVKEVYDAQTASMTTGTVSRVSKLQGWFLMVKSTKDRYPQSKLWGDGWAWSWFDAGNAVKTTSTDYKSDCQGCHVPAQVTDWIYVDGYPSFKK